MDLSYPDVIHAGPTDKQRELINRCLLGAVHKKGGWTVVERMPIWEVKKWITESLEELKAERKQPAEVPAVSVPQHPPPRQVGAAGPPDVSSKQQVCGKVCLTGVDVMLQLWPPCVPEWPAVKVSPPECAWYS
jgi:hypothetical protein